MNKINRGDPLWIAAASAALVVFISKGSSDMTSANLAACYADALMLERGKLNIDRVTEHENFSRESLS